MISSYELLVLLDQCLFIDRKRERGRKMFLYNNKIKKKKKCWKTTKELVLTALLFNDASWATKLSA